MNLKTLMKMKTINERAEAYAKSHTEIHTFFEAECLRGGYYDGATEQKAIDEVNPSDAVIMRILNAIGYEEESWIPIVRKTIETMED